MGLSYRTFLGPYVICKIHKVEVQKNILTCSDPQCVNYTCNRMFRQTVDAKFCTHCGTQFAEREVTVEKNNVDEESVYEDGIEKFLMCTTNEFCGEAHLWLPNIKIEGLRELWFNSKESARYWPILPNQIYEEVDRFEEFFAEAILILHKHYGDNNVIMSWGLIHKIS